MNLFLFFLVVVDVDYNGMTRLENRIFEICENLMKNIQIIFINVTIVSCNSFFLLLLLDI